MVRDRNDRTSVQDVEEINGHYITVKAAAAILGLNVATMSQKIYDHKFQAVRIAGVILCEKVSVQNYKAERDQMEREHAAPSPGEGSGCVYQGRKPQIARSTQESLARTTGGDPGTVINDSCNV